MASLTPFQYNLPASLPRILCFLYVYLPNSFEVLPPNEASLVHTQGSITGYSFLPVAFFYVTTLAWKRLSVTDATQGGRCSVQFPQDHLSIQPNCSHIQSCDVWQQCKPGDISSCLFFCKILVNCTWSLELNDFTYSISINQEWSLSFQEILSWYQQCLLNHLGI